MKPTDLNSRRSHDIGDFCDRIWANAFPQQTSTREPEQPNKRSGSNS